MYCLRCRECVVSGYVRACMRVCVYLCLCVSVRASVRAHASVSVFRLGAIYIPITFCTTVRLLFRI